ncbi:MAG: hypothetical protein ACOC1G_00890 [Phycisphaeraceae bacterium]
MTYGWALLSWTLLAVSDGWLVHGYAVAATAAACGIGHLAGRSVLRKGLAASDASRRSQAPLLAMVVRMFVAVPLLLAAIFAAGALFATLEVDVPPRHARFVTGIWAAVAYGIMVAIEARSAGKAYQHRVNAEPTGQAAADTTRETAPDADR